MAERPPVGLDPAIADYYTRAPEESRLQVDAFQLEAARTRELIERHAPPAPAVVYDVGGAGGAYAFWLAERGYRVHLLDATPRLVEVARARNVAAQHQLASCQVGDARALPFEDATADIVLLLGPLYHLVEADDRLQALREAARVLKPGGVVLAAGISRWASALDGLSRDLLGDPDFVRLVERDVREGQHRNDTHNLDYFTTAYFHTPEQLGAEMREAGLDGVRVVGIEGPGWIFPDVVARLADPARRQALLHVARMLEEQPSIVGASAHLMAVGSRR